MGAMNFGLTFYCDLSDTVTISFLGDKDSVLYSADIISIDSPHFSLAFCLAGSRYSVSQLPERYFRSPSSKQYRLCLSIAGRPKCIRENGLYVPKDWYCWLFQAREDD
jgi:hypothetical protein